MENPHLEGDAFVFDEHSTSRTFPGTCYDDELRLTPTGGTLAAEWWAVEYGVLGVIASGTLEPATGP
jgi:hypothetical protein